MSRRRHNPIEEMQSWTSGTFQALDPPIMASIREDAASLYVGLVLDLWLVIEGGTLAAAAHQVISKHAAQLKREAAWQHDMVTSIQKSSTHSPPSI